MPLLKGWANSCVYKRAQSRIDPWLPDSGRNFLLQIKLVVSGRRVEEVYGPLVTGKRLRKT